MPRGGRGGLLHSTRKPVDLTRIISLAEKNDLGTLVNAITDRIHRDVTAVFDSPPVSPIAGDEINGLRHHHWLARPLDHNHNARSALRSNMVPSPAADNTTAFKKAHHIVEKEEQEAMTPQLGELKKEATNSFRKWQNLVLLRLRDMVVNDPEPEHGNLGRGRGRGGPRGGFRGRGARGGAMPMVRPALTLATGPPRVPTSPIDLALSRRYPPIPNTLWPLAPEKRKMLLNIVLLMLLSHQEYSAYSRLLLLYLTSSLNMPLRVLQEAESRIARALASVAVSTPARDSQEPCTDQPKGARHWKFGLGGVSSVGALAEPLAAAGVGIVHEGRGLPSSTAAGLLGSLADSGHVVGSLFGMNASRPASKTLDAFSKEVPDFGVLSIHDEPPVDYPENGIIPQDQRRLRLVIVMSGWLLDKKDLTRPWRALGTQAEVYSLRWEMNALLSLGTALQTVIKSTAWGRAKKQITSQNLRLIIHNGSWPEPLVKMSKIIDNPWSVGMVRAEKAGVTLADAIMRSKFQGDRPVSLIGFSLSARVIYTCLMVLAERRCFGLVDSVVMMGLPAPSESRVWLALKSVVAGRLINVYSENDYILGFLCRTSNIHFGIAGLEEVQGADGVENYNVTRSMDGHLAYSKIASQVLREIGWEDVEAKPLQTARTTAPASGRR